jgi:transcriptional regulator with XRE-family HTH domain
VTGDAALPMFGSLAYVEETWRDVPGTSTAGPKRPAGKILAAGVLATLIGTSGITAPPRKAPEVAVIGDWTDAGEETWTIWRYVPGDPEYSTSQQVRMLRDLSGLTWSQLARLFGVDRRSLHMWATGGQLNARNAELLAEALRIVRSVATRAGDPTATRAALLAKGPEGSVFDQLAAKADSRPVSSSNSARAARAAHATHNARGTQQVEPPADLLGARHDDGPRLGAVIDAELLESSD